MTKIFDRKFEGLYTPRRINENVWFKNYQRILLIIVNTDYGRDLLCIGKSFPKITKIAKNFIQSETEPGKFITEFRIGAKYANIIRYKWQDFINYAMWFSDNGILVNLASPIMVRARGTTLTAYPDPDPETTTHDAWVRHINDNDTWANIRGGAGNSNGGGATSADWATAIIKGTSSGWFYLVRTQYLFDTSSISTDSIDDATFSLYATGKSLDNGAAFNVVASSPSSNTGPTNSDYSAFGTTEFSTAKDYSVISTSAYNDWTLNASGEAAINKTGVTKLGMREANFDIANSEPSGPTDTGRFDIRYADFTGTTNDPKLVVNHSAVTFTPKTIMF